MVWNGYINRLTIFEIKHTDIPAIWTFIWPLRLQYTPIVYMFRTISIIVFINHRKMVIWMCTWKFDVSFIFTCNTWTEHTHTKMVSFKVNSIFESAWFRTCLELGRFYKLANIALWSINEMKNKCIPSRRILIKICYRFSNVCKLCALATHLHKEINGDSDRRYRWLRIYGASLEYWNL